PTDRLGPPTSRSSLVILQPRQNRWGACPPAHGDSKQNQPLEPIQVVRVSGAAHRIVTRTAIRRVPWNPPAPLTSGWPPATHPAASSARQFLHVPIASCRLPVCRPSDPRCEIPPADASPREACLPANYVTDFRKSALDGRSRSSALAGRYRAVRAQTTPQCVAS